MCKMVVVENKLKSLQEVCRLRGYFCTNLFDNTPGSQRIIKGKIDLGHIKIGDNLCYANSKYFDKWTWKLQGREFLPEAKKLLEEIRSVCGVGVEIEIVQELPSPAFGFTEYKENKGKKPLIMTTVGLI